MTQNSTSEPTFHDTTSDQHASVSAPCPAPGGVGGDPGETARLPPAHPLRRPLAEGGTDGAPLLRRLRGQRHEAPPSVWFMRQAGRSLPEYRALREGTSMLDSCVRPEMAAEITLQPVRRHGVDAG